MSSYEQALQRFLLDAALPASADDPLRRLAEQAFRAGWDAAGGCWLLRDPIPYETE